MKLTQESLDGLAVGRHGDGNSLYLEKRKSGTASWLFRSPTSWMVLGEHPAMTLTQAREKAVEARALMVRGKDPLVAKKAAVVRASRTVEDCVRDYWLKKCQQLARKEGWIRPLEIHVFPKIGAMPVSALTAEDLVETLQPLWVGSDDGGTGLPTAERILNRMKLCLTRERVTGSQADPFICDVAKELLPTVVWEERPHPALAWGRVPDLWETIPNSIAGHGLRLLILTGLRVACVTKAEWKEVDWKERIWTVPKGRVKGWNAGFRVPLTRPMLDALTLVRRLTGDKRYIFASEAAFKKGYISENTWGKWLRENNWKDVNGDAITAHGFRSTFRDWAAKHRWERALTEHSIQHLSAKGTKVERAYWREDRIEERRELIEAWNTFVVSGETERQGTRQRARAGQRLLDETVTTDGMTLRDAERWARGTALDDEDRIVLLNPDDPEDID